MLRSLMTAASGMKAQQLQVDTIANNIANANTHGFKRSRLSFRSLLYETMREPGGPASANQVDATGLQIGSGTEVSASIRVFEQGVLEQTGGTFDLAVRGQGFFRVQLPNGEDRYTRNGSFRVDPNGGIVTAEGYPLVGAPTVPNDSISLIVAEDGTIASINSDDGTPQTLSPLLLTRFSNPAGLKSQGGNYYSETLSSGAAQEGPPGQNGTGFIQQGYLERSNVSTVDELVGLIVAQRNYEVNSRAIRVSDEMLQQVNQLVQ